MTNKELAQCICESAEDRAKLGTLKDSRIFYDLVLASLELAHSNGRSEMLKEQLNG